MKHDLLEKKNPPHTPVHGNKGFFHQFRFEFLLLFLFFCHTLVFSLFGIISFDRMEIIGIDPVCYYSYLRSLVFDCDLDLENEYRALDKSGTLLSYPPTPLGRRPNGFSIGPSLFV